MCGGTWPPNRGEPVTRTDNAILLDGADDLIDAPPAAATVKGEGYDYTGGFGAVYEPNRPSAFALTEGFAFGGEGVGAELPGVAGANAGLGGLAGIAPGQGVVLGFYGDVEGSLLNPGAFAAYGAGAYLVLTTASNCAK